jgi:hypothetical protein
MLELATICGNGLWTSLLLTDIVEIKEIFVKGLCCCTDQDKSIQVKSDFHISCLHFHPRLVKLDLQVFSLPRPRTSVASA